MEDDEQCFLPFPFHLSRSNVRSVVFRVVFHNASCFVQRVRTVLCIPYLSWRTQLCLSLSLFPSTINSFGCYAIWLSTILLKAAQNFSRNLSLVVAIPMIKLKIFNVLHEYSTQVKLPMACILVEWYVHLLTYCQIK